MLAPLVTPQPPRPGQGPQSIPQGVSPGVAKLYDQTFMGRIREFMERFSGTRINPLLLCLLFSSLISLFLAWGWYGELTKANAPQASNKKSTNERRPSPGRTAARSLLRATGRHNAIDPRTDIRHASREQVQGTVANRSPNRSPPTIRPGRPGPDPSPSPARGPRQAPWTADTNSAVPGCPRRGAGNPSASCSIKSTTALEC